MIFLPYRIHVCVERRIERTEAEVSDNGEVEVYFSINSRNNLIWGVTHLFRWYTSWLHIMISSHSVWMCTINPETTQRDVCDTIKRLMCSAIIRPMTFMPVSTMSAAHSKIFSLPRPEKNAGTDSAILDIRGSAWEWTGQALPGLPDCRLFGDHGATGFFRTIRTVRSGKGAIHETKRRSLHRTAWV